MPLRLLCDEHVGKKSFFPQLKRNFSATHSTNISKLGKGASDTEIWKHAVDLNFNVLTADDHFINGNADPGDGTHPGVILYEDDAQINSLVSALLGVDNLLSSSMIASNDMTVHIPDGWPPHAP